MRVLGYVISDSGRYSKFGYPDIRIPVEITTKYSKCNTFEVISDLLNSDNLKVAITQLCHELQV